MRRATARKQPKRAKPSAAITKLDLEEGRPQRPTEQEYANMVIYRSFVGEYRPLFAVTLTCSNVLL